MEGRRGGFFGGAVEYVSFPVAFVRSADFLAAPEAVQARWFRLLAYCAEQENGGVLAGAAEWPSRLWANIGVKRNVVESVVKAGLGEWVQGDFCLKNYPEDVEKKVKKRRIDGKTAAEAKAAMLRNKAESLPGAPAVAPAAGDNAGTSVEYSSVEKGRSIPATPKEPPEQALRLADGLRRCILEREPGHRIGKGANSDTRWPMSSTRTKWAREADRMHRIDGRDWGEAAGHVRWLWSDANQCAEFTFRVEAMTALRRKWDRIAATRARNATTRGPSPTAVLREEMGG